MRTRIPWLLSLGVVSSIALIAAANGAAQGGGSPAPPPPPAPSGKPQPPSGVPTGPLTILNTTTPTKSGDDTITISFIAPGSSATKQVIAATGLPGTANAADDILKNSDPVAKAKRYAETINDAAKNPSCGGNARKPPVAAAVVMAGNPPQPTQHVTVSGVDGSAVTNVNVADNTGQHNTETKLPFVPHVDGGAGAETEDDCMASVRFLGPIHGVTDDGAPATAVVGTGSYTSTLSTAMFLTVDELTAAFAADLAAHDVDVQIVNGALRLSVLNDGRTITAGTDDKGLATHSALGKLTP